MCGYVFYTPYPFVFLKSFSKQYSLLKYFFNKFFQSDKSVLSKKGQYTVVAPPCVSAACLHSGTQTHRLCRHTTQSSDRTVHNCTERIRMCTPHLKAVISGQGNSY